MKFEHLLGKKVKDLEVLGSSLVYKEKELLHKYKDQLEESDLEERKHHYEKKGLLDSDSDEEMDPRPNTKYIKDNKYNNGHQEEEKVNGHEEEKV